MGDSIEIKPRFLEPDAPNAPNYQGGGVGAINAGTLAAAQNAGVSKGIFTSIYENRIIVIIIVITIIIIGIIAYVIYHPRDDAKAADKNTNAADGGKTSPPASPLPPAATSPNAPTDKKQGGDATDNPSGATAASDSATTPSAAAQSQSSTPRTARPSTNSLSDLLARSKQTEHKNMQQSAAQTSAPSNMKSEDEIMQLMEDVYDTPAPDDNPAPTEEASTTTNQPEQPTTSAPVKNNDIHCSTMLSEGRRCRNKARSGGKCARHDG
jgi:hypothetical protein